jgi:hypothetical protein
VIPYTAGEPVVVCVDPGEADGIYTAPWGAIYTTPWGEVSPVTPEAVPGKPGHIKAGHLMFIESDMVEELLADGTLRDTTEGCLITATTDGNRVFFHVFAPNGHWVWALHECVFHHRFDHGSDYLCGDDEDDGDPSRMLLGVFPD